ncbi:MAG: NYN domain-containing protein [Clostridiales bacterium]|jgi:uncharacterized LabA/DUF88 family protein|nr:NYN domain-containing protein [Clostridiales bacterium]
MSEKKKYIVLADIESVRISYATFDKALKELTQFGEVAGCKFYGYSAKRTKDYGEFIQANNYDALSALPKKRKGKLDLRQVIDAVRLAAYPNIGGFFIIYGRGDIAPLIAYLKNYGMDVIAGVLEPDKNSELCNKVITLDPNAPKVDVAEGGYRQIAAVDYKKAPKKPAAPKVAAAPAAPAAPAPVVNNYYTTNEVAPAPASSADDDLIAQLQKILAGG